MSLTKTAQISILLYDQRILTDRLAEVEKERDEAVALLRALRDSALRCGMGSRSGETFGRLSIAEDAASAFLSRIDAGKVTR